ncbi:MAG: hypothetical protein JWR19_171 [Pedosphaera sp.]|nr:hypothetical protein [Pedosphaera sp.]
MNKTKRLAANLGFILCCALLGHSTYGQPSLSVGVSVPLPSVEIRTESDFYEPLAPQGEWVVVGSYGRCWRPHHVARDWRPYCNGNWERTDAGWYWVSDEPWAWATYHYGRWDFTDEYGWYWVPQTQWAPAWVSWHEGGGYVGWAPLQPSVRISVNGFVGFDQARISPRAFVFVPQGRFLDPIRPTMVVANNTTIISRTVNITNTKIVNNTVINEGPATAVIEKASGHKVQAVAVQELRHKEEAVVVAKQRTPAAISEKKVQTPVPSEVQPRAKDIAAPPERLQPAKPAVITPDPAAAAPKNHEVQSEPHKAIPAAPEFKPAPRPEVNHPPVIRAPAQPKVKQQERPASPSQKQEQQPAEDKPPGNERNGAEPGQGHDKGPKE